MEITSHLSNLIKSKRTEKKLTLTELSKQCNIAASTISSIENGVLTHVKDDTFKSITEALGISSEQSKNIGKNLKVGFGHNIWSAGIIQMLFTRDALNNYDITSFEKEVKNKQEKNTPVDTTTDTEWELEFNDDNNKVKLGPDYGLYLIKKPLKAEKSNNVRALSARELMGALEDKILDCVLLPRGILRNYTSRFITVASVVYSFTGNITITAFSKHKFDKTKLSERCTPSEMLDYCKSTHSKVVILYPSKTICEDYLENYLQHILNRHNQNFSSIEFKDIDISEPESVARQVSELCDIHGKSVMIWLMSWQPNDWWCRGTIKLEKQTDNEINDWSIDLVKELQQEEKYIYLDYALIFRDDEVLREKNKDKSLSSLLTALDKSTAELIKEKKNIELVLKTNKGRESQIDFSHFTILNRIAAYLDMPLDIAAKELVKINFRFTLTPEFYYFNENNKL